MTAAALTVENLSKAYGGVRALDCVSFSVGAGSIHGVIGPNGAGKSTLVDVMTGFAAPTAGSVTYAGKEIAGIPAHRVASYGVARTFQHTQVFDEISVEENLLTAGTSMRRRTNSSSADVVHQVLKDTGIHHLRHIVAGELAYGERRRLQVATALVLQPSFLLLDEPAAGMNSSESRRFVEVVKTISRRRTILLIEHDMSVIRALCAQLTVLVDGKVVRGGATEPVLADPYVADVYLGRARRHE